MINIPRQGGFKVSEETKDKMREDAIQNKRYKNFGDITGEKNGNSKLTDEDIKIIHILIDNDITTKKISELFNISTTYVNLIKKGERRNYIEKGL